MDVKLCLLLLIGIVSVATYPRIPRSMYLDDYDIAALRSYRVGRAPPIDIRFGYRGGSRYYEDDYQYDDQPRSPRMPRPLGRYRTQAVGNVEFITAVQAYNDSTTIPPPTPPTAYPTLVQRCSQGDQDACEEIKALVDSVGR